MSTENIKTTRKGRELELLVKRIKQHQEPDSKVLSPEFVPDIDTGQPREIDVGIRLIRNGEPFFIAVECRDRESTQSVEWVEQIICKKNSIQADVLVAISSSNFTKPARVKALKHGVLLARMSDKLPEEIVKLSKDYFISMSYLSPGIIGVDLKFPINIQGDLDSYSYRHRDVDKDLSLMELAQVWTTPNLVRTIPRFVKNWEKDKFAKIGLSKIFANILFEGREVPIIGANISYELNYSKVELPLQAVKELSVLDDSGSDSASSYSFGEGSEVRCEVIVDDSDGNLRMDLLGKGLLAEGKVLIGSELKASRPVNITMMSIDI